MKKIQNRNSSLIYRAYKKLLLPDVFLKLNNIIISLINSLIVAKFIGLNAIAAITLVTSLTLVDECLHDLLVSGIGKVLIKYKSKGQNEKANRAFGAILANALLWYIIVYIILLIFMRQIFGLFTKDSVLISECILYFIPMAVCAPFQEVGLCLERGFITDGNIVFFGMRPIITNITNMVLSILVVTVINGGILGISIASCLASLIGYMWILSYFFYEGCTIRPDFAVLSNFEETKKYLKEEIEFGRVYALDDGMGVISCALFNKAVLMTGGIVALTAIGICNSLINIVDSINSAIKSTENRMANIFYSNRDYQGIVRSLKVAIIFTGVFSLFSLIILNVFSIQFGLLFGVDNKEVMSALRVCLFFNSIKVIADSFSSFFSSHLLIIDKSIVAMAYAFFFNIVFIGCTLIGFTGISFTMLMCIFMISSVIHFITEGFAVFLAQKEMLKKKIVEICNYSYELSEDSCAQISQEISKLLYSIKSLFTIEFRASILSEECNKMLLYVNRNVKKSIFVDFRVTIDDDECVITIVDTGIIFDPINRLSEFELSDELNFSRQILKGLSPQSTYARVADLNVSHLVIPLETSNKYKGISS